MIARRPHQTVIHVCFGRQAAVEKGNGVLDQIENLLNDIGEGARAAAVEYGDGEHGLDWIHWTRYGEPQLHQSSKE